MVGCEGEWMVGWEGGSSCRTGKDIGGTYEDVCGMCEEVGSSRRAASPSMWPRADRNLCVSVCAVCV